MINEKDYYILVPVNDNTLKLQVPIEGNRYLRELISKEKLEEIINIIPQIEIINIADKLIENEYKRLMNNSTFEDLIKIIKTTYFRNRNRVENNRKISEKDEQYFERAEKYLYTEFSVVLNQSYDETKKYVVSKVEELIQHSS